MYHPYSSGRAAHWLTRGGLVAAFAGASLLSGLAAPPLANAQTAPTPTIFLSNASAPEGTDEVFTVGVSGASYDVSVTYRTGDDTALAGIDYVGTAGTTVTVPKGQTSAQFHIPTLEDNMWEKDKSFNVEIINPTAGTILQPLGTATIVNDDAYPQVTVKDVSVVEGNSGARNAVFNVELSNPSYLPVGFSYRTVDGTALGGTATTPNVDYRQTTGTFTWTPGTNATQQVMVPVKGDVTPEGNETFQLAYSAINASVPQPQATATILDDDPVPTVTIGDLDVREGNAAATPANLTVSLSSATTSDVTVKFKTKDGSATAMQDYIETAGSLTIPAGATSGTVQVGVIGDLLPESNEDFSVTLFDPVNATIGDAVATVFILNDD
jgi:hypothetical protein